MVPPEDVNGLRAAKRTECYFFTVLNFRKDASVKSLRTFKSRVFEILVFFIFLLKANQRKSNEMYKECC